MARKSIFTLLFLFISLSGQAQNRVDSLQNALAQAKLDTHMVQLLIQLGSEVMEDDRETAGAYLDDGFELAMKLKDASGLFELGMAYNLLGANYADEGEMASGKYYYRRSLEIFNTLENPFGIATLSANLGDIYLEEDSNKLAEKYYAQALPALQSAGDKESYLQVQLKRGINLSDQRKYQSLSRLLEPLEKDFAESGDINMRQTFFALLSDGNAERKKFRTAYNFSVKAAMASDSVWAAEMENMEQLLEEVCQEKIKEAEEALALQEKPSTDSSDMEKGMFQVLIFGGVLLFFMLILIVSQAIKIKNQKKTIADLEA
jgi:tetratricopeptide (TPR) repeat protein